MRNDLLVHFDQTRSAGLIRRSVRLEHPSLNSGHTIFWEFPGAERMPEPVVLDAFAFAFVLYAMAQRSDLVIRGPVSRRCLQNIRIFQEAWHCWRPDLYHMVEVRPDRVVTERRLAVRRLLSGKQNMAISAFSGGVDASFLALRHAPGAPGNASYRVGSAVMTLGFDVAFGETVRFEALRRRVAPFLESLGIDLKIVRTNVRDDELQEWEHAFGAQVACALHQFSHEASFGLLGSSEPYSRPRPAWGSTPSTDYLLSGGDMHIVHDGAGFSRTQKVEEIAKHPVARSTLKVCWQGDDPARNCGTCEKCTRTKLNFLAVGDAAPPCFDQPLNLRDIPHIVLANQAQLSELETIADYCDAKEVRAPWLEALHDRIDRAHEAIERDEL